MAKHDKDSDFEEATRFDPQRSLRVAIEHEKPVRVLANENLLKTTIDPMSDHLEETAPVADMPPETLNPDDFTPIPPADELIDAAKGWGPLYLDDEVLGSHSMRVKFSPEDASFFKAATKLNPKRVSDEEEDEERTRLGVPPGSTAPVRIARPKVPTQSKPPPAPSPVAPSPVAPSPVAPAAAESQGSPVYPPRRRPARKSQPASIRVERASSAPEHRDLQKQILDKAPDPNRFLSKQKIRSELIRSDSADPKLIEGSRIGNYEVIRKIGQGGMGVVYEGRHLLLPRRVAIKFLLTGQGHNEDQIRRFLGEAVAAAQIGHKGVVDIYDYGYDNNNSAYLVMEYIDGQGLQSIMKRSGQLPVPMALRIVRDVADVLAAAHQSGIVHRDLKPDNIVLSRDEHGKDFVKVLDFGVAKFVNAQSMSGNTQVGSILGTPWYMPPEQCQGFLTVDYRSDIYALGCVFYQMVCGKVPFAGSLRDVLLAHIHSAPPPPRALNPSIQPGVEQLILHMMAKAPADRPNSMEEVSRVLADFVEPPPDRQREARTGMAGQHHRPSSSRAWLAPALAAIFAGTATAAAFYFLKLL